MHHPSSTSESEGRPRSALDCWGAGNANARRSRFRFLRLHRLSRSRRSAQRRLRRIDHGRKEMTLVVSRGRTDEGEEGTGEEKSSPFPIGQRLIVTIPFVLPIPFGPRNSSRVLSVSNYFTVILVPCLPSPGGGGSFLPSAIPFRDPARSLFGLPSPRQSLLPLLRRPLPIILRGRVKERVVAEDADPFGIGRVGGG
jgi:hypothetical protein